MSISLVIPGRNCQRTIRACLGSVAPLLDDGQLSEIVFVDDGSTDRTAEIVGQYPVRVIAGRGGGAGAARNLGWQAAQGELIWFIDSDCVAEPQALARLASQLNDERTAGVGGSYANACPESLVASLIHEEIVARHRRMPSQVNFLGTYNVLYRRSVLAEIGGFDEQRYNGPGIAGAEDTELAFRLVQRGYVLRFEPESRVAHFHLTNYWRYLRVQLRHGFYRMRLYADYPRRAGGDSYSSLVDHVQPPLAMLLLASLPLAYWEELVAAPALTASFLAALQVPMAAQMIKHSRSTSYLAYIPFGLGRAIARGVGASAGSVDVALQWLFRRPVPRLASMVPAQSTAASR